MLRWSRLGSRSGHNPATLGIETGGLKKGIQFKLAAGEAPVLKEQEGLAPLGYLEDRCAERSRCSVRGGQRNERTAFYGGKKEKPEAGARLLDAPVVLVSLQFGAKKCGTRPFRPCPCRATSEEPIASAFEEL